MPAAEKPIVIEPGANFRMKIRYPKDNPIPMATGWTARMQVRSCPDDDVILMNIGTATGEIVLQDANVNAVPGDADYYNISIDVPPEDTLLVERGVFAYDLLITQGVYTRKLLHGRATVVKPVTILP